MLRFGSDIYVNGEPCFDLFRQERCRSWMCQKLHSNRAVSGFVC